MPPPTPNGQRVETPTPFSAAKYFLWFFIDVSAQFAYIYLDRRGSVPRDYDLLWVNAISPPANLEEA